MNTVWSSKNKEMQTLLKKESSFKDGMKALFELRNILMEQIFQYKKILKREDYDAMPFMNAKGYHSKTVAYSLWHIFRIEDIVLHTLIQNDKEILFSGKYQKKISSPIVTTGNELVKQQIADFSKQLNIEQLFKYIEDVKKSTEDVLSTLTFSDLKRRMSSDGKESIVKLGVVSPDENASWLIDYWMSKDVKGLIQMPFSRHWIMHIEACSRIIAKLGFSV